MIRSILLPSSSSSSSVLFENVDLPRSKTSRVSSMISCSSGSNSNFPKLGPFGNSNNSSSKFDLGFKELPLIQKTEMELTDYCTTLEGEECYNCWQAYFELVDLESELSKEDVERLILQSGGVKSLISWIHCMSKIPKQKNKKANESMKTSNGTKQEEVKPFPIPDGLPKTKEEIEEEEKAEMPESSHTRLLRAMHIFPAWYIPRPDHETD